MNAMLRHKRSVNKTRKGKGIGGKPYKEKQKKRKHSSYSTSGIKTNELCWFRGSSTHTKGKSKEKPATKVKLSMSAHSNSDKKESETASSLHFTSGIMTNELCWFRDSFTQSIEKSWRKTVGNVNPPQLISNNLDSKEVKQALSCFSTSGIKTDELCWFRDAFTHSNDKLPNHNIQANIMCSNEHKEELSYCGIKTRDLCWFRDGSPDQQIQRKLPSKSIVPKNFAKEFPTSTVHSLGGKTTRRVSLEIALESARQISLPIGGNFDDATDLSPLKLTRSRSGSTILRVD